MQSYIWLGVRESEIADTKGLFTGSVTIFGTGKGENHAMECDLNKRLDHNGSCPEYDSYFQNKMRQILEEDPAIRFIPYDASDFAGCPLDLQEKLIFCNDQELLNRINNKIILKQDLKTIVPVLPYILLQEKECTSDKLQSIFPSAQAAVVQRAYSYGGSGTSLVPFSGGALKNDLLQNDEICMVTAFQEHSISVNIHCVLYSDEFVLFPPSLQIIDQSSGRLEYIGSDYSAYQLLSDAEQRLVRETATSVCQWLRQQGYLGVCGIDLLLTDSACYFMEVNPRFQASTALLNHYLVQNGLPCLQEYHQDSFCSPVCTLQFPIATAAGSVITLHYRESEREQLMWL